jgi:uncharacterized protein YgbK (DUF1537 family)
MQDNEYLTTGISLASMVSTEVFALADDLTGALEVGALFAATGASVKVGIECAPAAVVTVVDLESRHLDDAAAARIVRRFASAAKNQGELFVFLKIDSTMRGPVAASLDALAGVWPERVVFFTPAYPKLGRTVVNGHLLVDGVPVNGTAFRHDPTHPARSSYVGEMLRAFRVFDAASDEDLARIARAGSESATAAILAGSGGLAREAAALLPISRGAPQALPRIGKPIIVSGSMHAISAEQLRHSGSWPVIECSGFSSGLEALENLTRAALERIELADTMIVFGGDTARSLMNALGIREIEPLGEALPGVPVSRIIHSGRPLTLITKAGGFGGPDLLPQLAAALHTEI